MSLMQLPKVIESVNELGQRVAKLELMVKELQDAFVMATQQTIVKEVEKRTPKSK
jgi:cobalamin-dependent methionine synthase I